MTNYPTDMLHSPPQVLEADVTFKAVPLGAIADDDAHHARRAGGLDTSGVTQLAANRQGTPRNAFTDLINSNRADLAFLLTAAVIAAVLGGFHALEPGHGKTLVAADLVGSHGKARHAVMLGGIVTAAHRSRFTRSVSSRSMPRNGSCLSSSILGWAWVQACSLRDSAQRSLFAVTWLPKSNRPALMYKARMFTTTATGMRIATLITLMMNSPLRDRTVIAGGAGMFMN